jgi:hypothetical protein
MVRESLRSPSTEGRSFDRNRIMEPTDEQASRQSSMSATLNVAAAVMAPCVVWTDLTRESDYETRKILLH